jgi:hypothetical protein
MTTTSEREKNNEAENVLPASLSEVIASMRGFRLGAESRFLYIDPDSQQKVSRPIFPPDCDARLPMRASAARASLEFKWIWNSCAGWLFLEEKATLLLCFPSTAIREML